LFPVESEEQTVPYIRDAHCTTSLGQGPQRIIFSALEGRRQYSELNY